MKSAGQPQVINLPGDYRRRTFLVKGPAALILVLLSLTLQSLTQAPINWSWAGWFALAPLVVAAAGYPKVLQGASLFFLASLVYFMVNLYWLIGVTFGGWIGLSGYLALYYLLCGFILKRVYLKYRWPFTLVLPIVWTGQEYLRATLMTGFPWLFLAHGQHDNSALIQIADLTGAYGVTFMLAMVNGLICDMLLRPLAAGHPTGKRRKPLSTFKLMLITLLCVGGVWLYGRYRLTETPKTIHPGPTVAVIQETFPQFIKMDEDNNQKLFDAHLDLTRQALQADVKPDLVVWPETITPPLNNEFLNFSLPGYDIEFLEEDLNRSRECDRLLRETARGQAGILVGSPLVEWKLADGYLRPVRQANTAILYLPNGERFEPIYLKMHLVPFGEVVPFKQSIPWLHEWLMKLTPYDFDYTLESGREPVQFHFDAPSGKMPRFAVAICYEDAIPRVPRQLIKLRDGKKAAAFLLNISNDGWYVSGGRDGKPVRPTTELTQHLAVCQFRAIENRISIARAVNCGISGFIRPDGTVQRQGLAGTLPADPARRQVVSGFLTDTVQIDSRVTFYSRFGDIFALIVTGLMALITLAILFGGKSKHKNILTPRHEVL